MTTWTNADGLKIRYGQDEAAMGNGGEYKTFDAFRVVEIELDLADLTASEVVQSNVIFPAGFVLAKVEVLTEVAAATGTAIDVGLVRVVGGTEVDYDGILAAFPTASMNAPGEYQTLVNGTSYAGALVGTVVETDDAMYLSASRTDSTAFTAGHIVVRTFWYKK